MVFSARSRAYPTSQRIESDWRRSGRISIGTWYVAPPTLRDFTSTTGFTFSSAFFMTATGSSFVFSLRTSSDPYTTFSATRAFPSSMMAWIILATSTSPYTGSGETTRLETKPLLGIRSNPLGQLPRNGKRTTTTIPASHPAKRERNQPCFTLPGRPAGDRKEPLRGKAGSYLGRLVPYFDRDFRLSGTPTESSFPRMMWYRTPGRSFTCLLYTSPSPRD